MRERFEKFNIEQLKQIFDRNQFKIILQENFDIREQYLAFLEKKEYQFLIITQEERNLLQVSDVDATELNKIVILEEKEEESRKRKRDEEEGPNKRPKLEELPNLNLSQSQPQSTQSTQPITPTTPTAATTPSQQNQPLLEQKDDKMEKDEQKQQPEVQKQEIKEETKAPILKKEEWIEIMNWMIRNFSDSNNSDILEVLYSNTQKKEPQNENKEGALELELTRLLIYKNDPKSYKGEKPQNCCSKHKLCQLKLILNFLTIPNYPLTSKEIIEADNPEKLADKLQSKLEEMLKPKVIEILKFWTSNFELKDNKLNIEKIVTRCFRLDDSFITNFLLSQKITSNYNNEKKEEKVEKEEKMEKKEKKEDIKEKESSQKPEEKEENPNNNNINLMSDSQNSNDGILSFTGINEEEIKKKKEKYKDSIVLSVQYNGLFAYVIVKPKSAFSRVIAEFFRIPRFNLKKEDALFLEFYNGPLVKTTQITKFNFNLNQLGIKENDIITAVLKKK